MSVEGAATGAGDRGPEIIACYWTLAGPVRPGDSDEASPYPLSDRLEAAAEAGYRGIGFVVDDLRAIRDTVGYPTARRLLKDFGMDHCQFEMLYGWWEQDEDERRDRALLIEAVESLEVSSSQVKCGPDLTGPGRSTEQYASTFHDLAGEIEVAGAPLGLEFMPFGDVTTPAAALAIVEMAGRGGLVVDVWHVARGGTPYDALMELPADRIVVVELNDAAADPVGTLIGDTIDHRLCPGEGALDVPAFLAAIKATGYDGPFGVEILSRELREMPLEQAARRSGAAAAAQLAAV